MGKLVKPMLSAPSSYTGPVLIQSQPCTQDMRL